MIILGALALLMAGCSAPPLQPPATQTTPADPPAGTGAASRQGEDLVERDALPAGHCGQAPAEFESKVYQGTPGTECAEAIRALEAMAQGRDDDSRHVEGHGTDVLGWSCLFPMDTEIADYSLTIVCEKAGQKFFVRPASVEVPAGYHVAPWDYLGNGMGSGGDVYFTTETRKHQCGFIEDRVGCDNHSFPDDLPTVDYMGAQQQPTAIELAESGSARSTAYGDPVYSLLSDTGEWGAETEVLGYGQILMVRGITCTTDEERGVVCTNGGHGFEISSSDYALH